MSVDNKTEKFFEETLCPIIEQSSNSLGIDLRSLLAQIDNSPSPTEIFDFLQYHVVYFDKPGRNNPKTLVKAYRLAEDLRNPN